MLPKRTAIVLASMLIGFPSFSQLTNLNGSSEAGLPGVVMPSPDNATLTRKITENIDLYTGQLNVEIPLYTFKSRHIEVPISLQATANSLNMNDPGSFVGMGWHLNAGGVITRVMRNLPDEVDGTYTFYDPVQEGNRSITAYGYFKAGSLNYDPKRFHPLMPSASLAQEYTAAESVGIINVAAWDTRINRVNHGLDLEPDEFYFNFGKYSGKFVINQQKQVVPIIGGQLTIIPIIANNKITGFTVTTDDGFIYEFGDYAKNAVEETKFSSFSKATLLAYKHICNGTKTERIQQQDIVFPVYIYALNPVVPSMEGRAQTKNETEYYPIDLMFNSDEDNHSYSEYPAYSSSWYLTAIKSPNSDIVNFTYEDNGALTYIESSVITSTKLTDQGYNTKSQDCPPPDPGGNKFVQFSSFTPPIQDPRELYWVHPSYCDQTETVNTITLYSKKLKEISSSQGYTIQFFRNTSRPEMPGDKRLDKISVTYNGQLIKNFLFNYEVVRSNSAQEYYSLKHHVPKRIYNTTFVRSELSEILYRGFAKKLEESMRYRMYLTHIQEEGANGELVPPYKIDYFSKETLPYRTTLLQDKYGYYNTYEVPAPDLTELQAGVIKKISYPTGGFKEFEFEVSGNGTYWNGLRIKTVNESASAIDNPIITNYTYGNFAVSDRAFTSYMMYDRYTVLVSPALNMAIRKVDFKEFSSTRRSNPESSTRGVAGGYTFVETSQPGNGSKRIEFTTANDPNSSDPLTHTYVATNYTELGIHDIGNAFPYPPYNSIDWKRGLPKAEFVLDNNGKKLKSTHYEYDFDSNIQNNNSVDGIFSSKYRITFNNLPNNNEDIWNWMLFGRYSHFSRWQLQKSVEEREYLPDGIAYRSAKIENTFQKRTTTTPLREYVYLRQTKLLSNSKNEQLISHFRYPHDFDGLPNNQFMAGVVNLQQKKIWTAPVEQYQYLQNQDGTNKRYISGTLYQYYTPYPKVREIYTLKKGSSYTGFYESNLLTATPTIHPDFKADQQFHSYDSYGNVLKQKKVNDVEEVYVWDYDKTFPVAKATNTNGGDVAYTSFETAELGGWTLNAGSVYLTSSKVTGKRSLQGGIRRTIATTGKYIITAWSRSSPAKVNTLSGEVLTTANGWTLYKWLLTNPASVEVTGSDLDEVRLYPENASMITYTFSPLTGMTSKCDENNRIIHYEYDGLQRLVLTRNENGDVISTVEYNYQSDNSEPVWVSTAERKCKPCESDPQYTTNIQMVKQIDRNPKSPTYNQTQWLEIGVSSECVIQPAWTTIGTPSCLLNSGGIKTGFLKKTQKDMNPCSPTYNTTREIQEIDYGTCPTTLPNWQPLEETRCQPCPANPAYQSGVQEKKFIDLNPSSTTHNQYAWFATSTPCIVESDWQFTTSPPRCETITGGHTTGREEREQKDMNPCSGTYNTTRWVIDENSTPCPRSYFIDVTIDPIYFDYGYTLADIYVSFYSDAQLTIPLNASNLPYTMIREDISGCTTSIESYQMVGSGTSYLAMSAVIFELFHPTLNCTSTYVYSAPQ